MSLHTADGKEVDYPGYERAEAVRIGGHGGLGGPITEKFGGISDAYVRFPRCSGETTYEVVEFRLWSDGEQYAVGSVVPPLLIRENVVPCVVAEVERQ